jgi:hypothetical protein
MLSAGDAAGIGEPVELEVIKSHCDVWHREPQTLEARMDCGPVF